MHPRSERPLRQWPRRLSSLSVGEIFGKQLVGFVFERKMCQDPAGARHFEIKAKINKPKSFEIRIINDLTHRAVIIFVDCLFREIEILTLEYLQELQKRV